MKYTKPFYIVINPTGSLFAKTIQRALQGRCVNKIYRRAAPKPGLSFLKLTQPALNKVEQFEAFHRAGVSAPQFATGIAEAKALNVKTLFARRLINSTNGRGIVEFDGSAVQYPPAPLYTEYIPKKAEYRVHVFNGEVIDVQQKKQKSEFAGARNTRVRNLAGGYVYCRNGIAPPDGCTDLAVRAVAACGYLYGAVDIIYNEKRNACYVLEVNSRPGLCESTVDKYAAAIVKHFNLKERD
jgi:predicted ATP-grasp superfamily ATP-dependent carboligase